MPLNSAPPFYPGDTGQLTKAQLQATEGANTDAIDVYFNPKEITIDKQVPWQVHKNSEGDAPTLEFTAGSPKELTCELMFDMFEDKGDVYATYVSKLENLALIDSDLNRPPLCTFTWGSNLPVFKGVIEDLNVKYTLFLPDGTPSRCTVNIKMKQAETLMNKQEAADANKAAASQQKGTTPPAGQRMDTTAQQVGDGSNARATASRNGVDDMANPPAGQTYQGPPRR
jgi:hypothetical protein